jgi:hypothetical protein
MQWYFQGGGMSCVMRLLENIDIINYLILKLKMSVLFLWSRLTGGRALLVEDVYGMIGRWG